jgi:hypothetical protein
MLAGLAQIAATEFAPGFYPSWYFTLTAVSFGLILPVIASLQVIHQPLRASGAVLGTIAGATVVILGLGASANPDLIPAALFVRGVWWWTIGKLWVETAALPRALGWLTMLLAIACFALVAIYALTGISMGSPDLPARMILGAWLIALGLSLWQNARVP